MKHFLLSIIIFISFNLSAQLDTEERWDAYMATYEGGKPGTTILRMDLIEKAPVKGYEKVLITGVYYDSTREDGFPDLEILETLYKLNDELEKFLNKHYEAMPVGSFTHDFERLSYFYIKTDKALEKKLKKFYKTNFPDFKPYIKIKEDPQWKAYTYFLYPNEETLEYMSDRSVVNTLIEAGDALKEERRVDHWLWFDTEEEVKTFIKKTEAIGYQLEGYGKMEAGEKNYSVQIWRSELPDLDSIYGITSKLREIAKEDNGTYDGWETFIVKE
jgi:uncharacterized protein (TIGR01619 family)